MEKLNNYKQIFNLDNKVAIITGGYGHLGKAMTLALLSHGAIVIVAGRSFEKFKETFKDCSSNNLEFEFIDITKSEEINRAINNVYKKYKRIDVLINNAHAAKGRSQDNMSDEDWAFTMDGVVGSVQKTIRAVLPIMKKQKEGKIINITSMYGIVSPDFNALYEGENCEQYTNPPHYGAAKAAMIQLTKYYAVYLGNDNIQVNAISPGPFPKKNIQIENNEFIERLKKKNPLGRIGLPENITGPVLLLGSKGSDYMTGQVIQVDGGWTIW